MHQIILVRICSFTENSSDESRRNYLRTPSISLTSLVTYVLPFCLNRFIFTFPFITPVDLVSKHRIQTFNTLKYNTCSIGLKPNERISLGTIKKKKMYTSVNLIIIRDWNEKLCRLEFIDKSNKKYPINQVVGKVYKRNILQFNWIKLFW